MKSKGYQFWLYDYPYEDIDQFFSHLTNIIESNNAKINLLLLYSTEDLVSLFKNIEDEFVTIEINHSLPIFTLTITREISGEKKRMKVVVIRYYSFPVYLIISDYNRGLFKTVLSPLLNKLYPLISKIFITNTEIYLIFKKLIEEYKVNIRINYSICKKRLLNSLKKNESQITYTDIKSEDFFESIRANDQWISSLRFQAIKTSDNMETVFFEGFVSRNGLLSVRKNFTALMNIVSSAINYASVRNDYLKVREDNANEKFPEPIVIKFDYDIFKENTINEKFSSVLMELKDISISEYHSNPYYHVSLFDYLDRSSYDVWIVSSDRIVIVPQIIATVASMNRILDHIFEKIQDGKIEEYKDIII
jgi:hypothetical protein